jgi:hypothetical protein
MPPGGERRSSTGLLYARRIGPLPPELAALERLASVAQVGGFRPPSTPRSSWIGAVLLGRPDESWPVSNGRPMWPACQVLVEELPAAPSAALADVALVTVFIDLLDLPFDRPCGEGWELRTYATTDGLVPLIEPERPVSERRPEEDLQLKPFPVLWRPRAELPSRDETPTELYDVRDALDDDDRLAAWSDLDGLKVGGWPATIQSVVDWTIDGRGRVADAEFVLQIDSDEKADLWIGDAGAAYIAWSPTSGWLLSWQCY